MSATAEHGKHGQGSGLAKALDLGPRELVSLVGAGGKTTLMQTLAAELCGRPARVITTTTTRIYRPQSPLHLEADPDRMLKWLADQADPGVCHCLGAGLEQGGDMLKVVGLDRRTVDGIWEQGLVDYLLVEADGAGELPIKAPRAHEPVIPGQSTMVVGVMGLSAVSKPMGPERVFALDEFCLLTRAVPGQELEPCHLAKLITHPQGLFKGAPPAARRVVLLNQADVLESKEVGREIASLVQTSPDGPGIILASLQQGWWERV